MPGANSPILGLSSTQASDAGTYQVWIENEGGIIKSRPAILSFSPEEISGPIIDSNSLQVLDFGGLKIFGLTANGEAGSVYQAYFKVDLDQLQWTPIGAAQTAPANGELTFLLQAPPAASSLFIQIRVNPR